MPSFPLPPDDPNLNTPSADPLPLNTPTDLPPVDPNLAPPLAPDTSLSTPSTPASLSDFTVTPADNPPPPAFSVPGVAFSAPPTTPPVADAPPALEATPPLEVPPPIPTTPDTTLPPQSPETNVTSDLGFSTPPVPPPLEPTPSTPAPAVAPVKPSPFRFVTPILIGLAVLGIIYFVVTKLIFPPAPTTPDTTSETKTTTKQASVTLNYQGLWEPEEVMRPVLDEFEKQNPDIKVVYQAQSQVDYLQRLQTSLATQTPPDVVRYHATWLPMLIGDLLPAPADTLSSTEIQSNFYPVASQALVVQGQVYGVPLTSDGLALFINQEVLDLAQAQPPKNWYDVRTLAQQLTKRDPTTGQITQAGIALGTATNVDHWPDIVTLMLLQAGVDLTKPDSNEAALALQFYTEFVTKDAVWDATLPSSVQAFASGKVAMILAPSYQAIAIKAANPTLNWKIYPVPQLPDSTPVSLANFWAEGVTKNSAHPQEAWTLVKFLASSQAQQLLFDAASSQRGFGQAPANKALATTTLSNPIIGPYVQDASTAKTFYTLGGTFDGDTGINSRMNKYLEDAINAMNQGQPGSRVLPTVQEGWQQVLGQYGIISVAPSPATTQ